MNNEDLALGSILGTLDDEQRTEVARAMHTDEAFAAEVARAQEDIDSIARGLTLVAGQAVLRRQARSRPMFVRAIAATAAVVVIAGAAVLATRTSETAPAPDTAAAIPGLGDLSTLAGEAELIVTGRVERVITGTMEDEGGLDYQIAVVRVTETVAGEPVGEVTAFDYTYGAPWVSEGQDVLLFLVSSAGTVNEAIQPAHLQVMQGDAGSYEIRDGELASAPFTLADVRAAAG